VTPILEPGDVNPRVRALIVGACAVTIAIAFYGMQALWEAVEWVEDPYFTDSISPGRSHFWYTSGLGYAVCAAIALVWWPRLRIAQLLRVAVALPLIHIGAIIVAACVWSVLDADALAKVEAMKLLKVDAVHPHVPLPAISMLAIGFATMVVVGIAIKRRHGEWAHATIMLALSYLLLLGLWLPVVSRLAVEHQDRWRDDYMRLWDADQVARIATVPAAILAIAFVTLVFRWPHVFERFRSRIRTIGIVSFVIAILVAASLPNKAWLVYLESSYLVISAVVLAIAALLLLGCVSFVRLMRASWRPRRFSYHDGVIAADEPGEVARFEIASWLRGPRLTTRPFVVTTAQGNVPVAGAKLLVPLPLATTTLDIGEHATVLAPADRVVIAARTLDADGHPFRAADAAEIAIVSTPDAHRARFSDIALVVWRPAVAYLTILIVVAAPYLSIFLT
jgi:hypothetical protein